MCEGPSYRLFAFLVLIEFKNLVADLPKGG